MRNYPRCFFSPLSQHRTLELFPTSKNDIFKEHLAFFCTPLTQHQRRYAHQSITDKERTWKTWPGIGVLGISFTVIVAGVMEKRRTLHSASQKQNFAKPMEPDQPTRKALAEEGSTGISSWHGLSFLSASDTVTSISSTLSTWTWPSTQYFSGLQAQVSALMLELGRGPGSLYSQIVHDSPDFAAHPECEWDAEVRLGDDLCLSERAFLRERKRRVKKSFAKLIDIPENQLHEDDIPVVAIAGSGGGYRAMLNTIGSLSGAQETGLLDCVTYSAGISGSCWSLGLIYSGVTGSHSPSAAGEHAKGCIQLSYLDIATLDALITPPTNKYLLSGILRKAAGPSGSVSLVDLYGTFVASRLFVPSDLSFLDPRHMSLHQFRRNVDNGTMPLPIFTALQHVISPSQADALKNAKEKQRISVDSRQRKVMERQEKDIETYDKWLWYEFTPFEVGCDELGAWIPSWALGRQFMHGKSLDRRPELSFSILCGIFASAFCASLKDYFKEVQPTLRQFPLQLYGWLEEIITDNEEDLGIIHPILPSQLPNFLKGMDGQLRFGAPENITQCDTLGFMDAGAELNIPYYPLLRRNVDCIIALDASADSQDLWFTRAEELAVKRGLRTWPKGARWPVQIDPSTPRTLPDEDNSTSPQSQLDSQSNEEAANRKLAQTQESALTLQTEKQVESENREMPQASSSSQKSDTPHHLNSCEIWLGTTKENDSGTSRLDDLEEDALMHRDGIGIVYMPLVPNEKVPNFDPLSVSTWSRELPSDQSQKLLDVAEANFIDGKPKIKKLLRAIWLRKKSEREAREANNTAAFSTVEHART